MCVRKPRLDQTPGGEVGFGDSEFNGLQKGPAERATSKIVKKCQKIFRHFSTIFAQGKKRQKSSKSVKKFSTLFDNFRAAPFFRPFLGGSDEWVGERRSEGSRSRGGGVVIGAEGSQRGRNTGKMGSICHFPRALLASIWGHCCRSFKGQQD